VARVCSNEKKGKGSTKNSDLNDELEESGGTIQTSAAETKDVVKKE
jgi:hypothetical protein